VQDIYICELCQQAYEPEAIDGVKKLKAFHGYTVDVRLQEFRRVKHRSIEYCTRTTVEMEAIRFNSPKGKTLLAQMHETVTR